MRAPGHPEDSFQVRTSLAAGDDKSKDLEKGERLNKRFWIARDGDHFMGIPFECNLCHFRNGNERDPIHGNSKVNYTLLCIRQAIVDAFGSLETSTVSVNFRRLRRDYFASAEVLRIIIPVPVIATNKVKDRVGMGCAIQNLDASRRKGKWQDQLQWYLVRKTPAWYNNAWEAGAGSLDTGDIYSAKDIKLYESTSPTASR